MDFPVIVTSTDEDEVVDIEGSYDDDDHTRNCAATITSPCFHSDETSHVNVNNAPFERQKASKKMKINDADNEFTKWWKSAGEFQRPIPKKENRQQERATSDGPDVGFVISEESSIGSSLMTETNSVNISEGGNVSLKDEEVTSQSADNIDRASSFDILLQNERILDESGEVFLPPTEEVFLSLGEISGKEREKFSEFFSGRTKYSPHNYVTIRDTILKLWQERRPQHVNKVMLRPILKKCCGNVNNIGKIHRYLESIGAINFGSDSVWWKRQRRKVMVYRPPRTALDTDDKLKRALEQRMSGRSRKRHLSSDATTNNPIGGYTIDHANNNAIIAAKKTPQPKPAKKYNLVRCKEYGSAEECPYDIVVNASPLMAMDLHSHLCTNEVMGLLGGYVTYSNNGKVKVHIISAQPCKSSGSLRHCEMDPVSQSVACERLTGEGLHVVGWYHSHPVFPPQPSATDVTSQTEQQRLFSAHNSPFLGVILTPYFRHRIKTEVNIMHVDSEGLPFTLPYDINSRPVTGANGRDDLIVNFQEIISSSAKETGKGTSRLSHLLDPIVQGSTVTHLDKLMKSLSAYVTSDTKSNPTTPVIVTSESEETASVGFPIVASSYDVMTSPLHSDDDVADSYSIDQNFPSLVDSRLDDVIEIPYVDDVIELPECPDADDTGDVEWDDVLDKLKVLLLRAGEDVLK